MSIVTNNVQPQQTMDNLQQHWVDHQYNHECFNDRKPITANRQKLMINTSKMVNHNQQQRWIDQLEWMDPHTNSRWPTAVDQGNWRLLE
jgi:hypothetical protein